MTVPSQVMRTVLRGLIRVYQLFVSPFFPGCCRYMPSCSHYAAEAVSAHGVLRGGWLALRRLGRCRPGGGSGFDPVPAVTGDAPRIGKARQD